MYAVKIIDVDTFSIYSTVFVKMVDWSAMLSMTATKNSSARQTWSFDKTFAAPSIAITPEMISVSKAWPIKDVSARTKTWSFLET